MVDMIERMPKLADAFTSARSSQVGGPSLTAGIAAANAYQGIAVGLARTVAAANAYQGIADGLARTVAAANVYQDFIANTAASIAGTIASTDNRRPAIPHQYSAQEMDAPTAGVSSSAQASDGEGLLQVWRQVAEDLISWCSRPEIRWPAIGLALYISTAWYITMKVYRPEFMEWVEQPFWVLVSLLLQLAAMARKDGK